MKIIKVLFFKYNEIKVNQLSASQGENCISEVRAFQSAKKLNEEHPSKIIFWEKVFKKSTQNTMST